jgi:hypothetical protein
MVLFLAFQSCEIDNDYNDTTPNGGTIYCRPNEY